VLQWHSAVRPRIARWQWQAWADALAPTTAQRGECVVRVVDEEEGAALNAAFRYKAGPTNVLSFPFEPAPGLALPYLGDLVICAPVVLREAAAQGKPAQAHWAHMLIHGLLHLQGYDHQDEAAAEAMERCEVEALARLGYADPYAIDALDT
jgi:probable rRNA maturation factor